MIDECFFIDFVAHTKSPSSFRLTPQGNCYTNLMP
jgi:hypothetical protein